MKDILSVSNLEEGPADREAGTIVVGYVDEIHGPDGVSQSVNITKAEAKVLVNYYVEEMDHIQSIFNRGMTGSFEIRWMPYCQHRINAIVKSGILTTLEVQKLADEYYERLKIEAQERADRERSRKELPLILKGWNIAVPIPDWTEVIETDESVMFQLPSEALDHEGNIYDVLEI